MAWKSRLTGTKRGGMMAKRKLGAGADGHELGSPEEVVPIKELYRACEIAYELVGEGLGVGRVIARPFVGAPGAFKRTANRHDYALPPSTETLLDRVKAASIPVVAIGKIEDLFAGRGITVEDTRDGQRWRRVLEVARG